MIKARLPAADRDIFLIGLSAENRRRLGEDEPIRISTGEMVALGFPHMEIVIMGGETEASMMDDLRKAGFA